MAEKISELSGEAREKRIAELKAKMQAVAKDIKAAHAAGEAPAAAAPAPAKPKPAAAPAPAAAAPVAVAEAVVEAPVARPVREAAPAGNGTAAAAPKPAPKPAAKVEAEPVPTLTSQDMSRREFLTYAWGAALGLLTIQTGVASFLFMYPRFRAGEFGGKFFLGPESGMPAPDAAPIPNTTGKFWLVTTEAGEPRAIYMVCTHLGCLYRWEASNVRFECPCHGSKFTREGYYIEGPAGRSLDLFETTVEAGEVVVDTGKRIVGLPATESPFRAEVA